MKATVTSETLDDVYRATDALGEARANWAAALRRAHAEGYSLRDLEVPAGVSHQTVKRIVTTGATDV
jgi:lambda repressor-like predicted transcriptional regulator